MTCDLEVDEAKDEECDAQHHRNDAADDAVEEKPVFADGVLDGQMPAQG